MYPYRVTVVPWENCPCGQLWHEGCEIDGPWKGAEQRQAAARMAVRHLERRQEYWVAEVGREAYEKAVAYWRERLSD